MDTAPRPVPAPAPEWDPENGDQAVYGPLDAAQAEPTTALWWHLLEDHNIGIKATQGDARTMHAQLHAAAPCDHAHLPGDPLEPHDEEHLRAEAIAAAKDAAKEAKDDAYRARLRAVAESGETPGH